MHKGVHIQNVEAMLHIHLNTYMKLEDSGPFQWYQILAQCSEEESQTLQQVF